VKSSAAIIEISRSVRSDVPSDMRFRKWARAALGGKGFRSEVALRVVGQSEGRRLNLLWRGQDHATNVLSFPAINAAQMGQRRVLGDIVLCAPVIAREAKSQGKCLEHHYAHLLVHGCLHLLGYDHEDEHDARAMERREKIILKRLGMPDPYLISLAKTERV
jgi:probable rRNA maturation factor